VIVAISGSLRRESVNSAALRAVAGWAKQRGIDVSIAAHPGRLPLFDPDREPDLPPAVAEFRQVLERADAVLLAVPEYAFGIPGAFKNALDWTVGSGSLDGKRVVVLSVAHPSRGTEVRHALGRVLTAINARVTYHNVPVSLSDRDADGEIRVVSVVEALGSVVETLARAAQAPLRSR
jgi:chromate reductase, NAD(P)H dehydrogenase (quinone)